MFPEVKTKSKVKKSLWKLKKAGSKKKVFGS